jgi:hypothetical protein
LILFAPSLPCAAMVLVQMPSRRKKGREAQSGLAR